MKKIINANILKKVLCSMLLFIILSQIMIPTFAAIINGGEVEKSYEEWLGLWNMISSSTTNKDTSKITESVKPYIINKLGVSESIINYMLEKDENKKQIIIKAEYEYESGASSDGKALLKITKFSISEMYVDGQKDKGIDGVKELLDKTLDEESTNPGYSENIKEEIKKDISYDELKTISGYENEDQLKLEIVNAIRKNFYPDYENLEATKKNLTNEAIEQVVAERKKEMTYTVKITTNTALNKRVLFNIISINIPDENIREVVEKKSEEVSEDKRTNDIDEADLGGILLSPVFYLINFVADAVINVVGSVMMPEEKFDFGVGVLSGNKPDHGYTNSYPLVVNTESFLPDLGSAILSIFKENEVYYQYPNLPYTPEAIFSGKVELLSIDFITGKTSTGEEIKNESWLNIRKVISQWYQILRMIAIIGLLSVLIYIGIKIIISANAKDKAKYKEWIMDWFMAVAILFAMHIIMAFIISITGEFSNLMTQAFQGIEVQPTVLSSDGKGNFVTNLMGLVRFMIQSEDFYTKVGYEIMYIALIVYTIKFTFTYLKRVLNMAFLTLIAPIVALTYPIDKINDGKAQGFDMWLKEYIFNALLQPMHAVLYYVLVGSAVQIAAENPIYGIVVLAFMTEAEKLLKKIFGFDKAGGGTVGGMASAFAAGAIASNITKIAKLGGGNAGKGGAGGAEGENNLLNNLKPETNRISDDNLIDSMTGGGNSQEDNRNNNDGNNDENNNENDDENNHRNDDRNNNGNDEGNNDGNDGENNHRNDDENDEENEEEQNPPDDSNNNQQTGKLAKFGKGMGNVGKRIVKPVWEVGRGAKYNGKRLLKKAGRAALGVGLGIGAAAVQAGISITDGKYNPAEGIASLAAGYAGGGKIASGLGSLYGTYQEGTLSENPQKRNEELIKRAQEEWAERDDVIKHNKKYEEKERKHIIEAQKKLLAQGVTDLKEQDKCIKYMKKINGGSYKGITKEMAQEARIGADFYNKDLKEVGMQKAVRDLGERDKYKKGATAHIKNEDERKRQEKIIDKKFDIAARFLDAQK